MENAAIATVVSITGKAYARNADGELRELRSGDALKEGETVVTPDGGRVELSLTDGSPLVINDMPEMTLTHDRLAETAAGSDESAVGDESIDQVLAALESGEDLGDVLEATAAGASSGSGGDGNSFVRLGRIVEETNEFTGIVGGLGEDSATFDDNEQQLIDAIDDAAATAEGEAVTIPVELNDEFNYGEVIIVVSDPANGTAVLNPDNTITYTPDPGFSGQDEFTYTATVPNGTQADTANVVVDVIPEADPVPLPTIAIGDDIVVEGDIATVTISLSQTWTEDVTVSFNTADGTATIVGKDYNANGGTVTIKAGDLSTTVSVVTNRDKIEEGAENIFVNLSDPVNATIADGEGEIIITDDYLPPTTTITDNYVPPTISISDVAVSEGDVATLTVSLSRAIDEDVTFKFDSADGSATVSGGDYNPATGEITIAAGTTEVTISATTNTDNLDESTEQFTVDLSEVSNAVIADGTGVVTIIDDFTPPPVIDDPLPGSLGVTPGASVLDEENLPSGSVGNPGDSLPTKLGSFTVVAEDGLQSLSVTADSGIANIFVDGVFNPGQFVIEEGAVRIDFVDYSGPDARGEYTIDVIATLLGPLDNTGANSDQVTLEFLVDITDVNGDSAAATRTAVVIDDEATASLDIDTVTEGSETSGNVLNNDESGADGYLLSGGVVGVRVAGGDLTSDITDGSTTAAGIYGDLKLNADGSYTYKADANTLQLGAQDVFVYTITDADGDTSTTTLTITHTDSGFDTVADDVAVNEAGLVGGSSAGDGSHMVTGSLADPGLGGTAPYTFTLQDPAIGNNGTLSLDASTGAYTYTLTSPVTGVDTGDNAANTVDNRESFSVLVADADGNTETVTITVDVIDDVPVATLDTDTVTEGTQLNVLAAEGVLSNDVLGADNAVSSTRVSAVGSSNAGTAANASFVGNALDGEFGSLLLRADGSYTYNADANTMPLGAVDVFSYEITDADGDTSTTTLTITHTDSGFDTVADDVAVNEAGLAGGSSAGDGSHMVTGSLADPGLGGTAPYTFTLQDPAIGNNGTLSLDASTGAYTYTLTSPVTGVDTGDNAANTVDNRESFSVLVADADGNTETVTITVDVIDDVPVATLDTDTVTEGTQLNVLAAEGVLSNDVLGADNAVSSTRVSAVGSSNAGTAANASFVGNALDGEFGSLLLRADGSYTYNADANTMPLGAVDVFSYEITDADGDTSTTTLTITHTDSGFDAVADDVAVNEAGLVGGSSAGDGSHMVTGSLADPGLGGTAPYTFTLQDPAIGNNGTLSLNASTGAYTYTLTSPVTGVDTGDNAANTVDNRESFSVLVADADGNTETVTITVDVIDDVPVATLDTDTVTEGTQLNVLAAEGVLSNDVLGADNAVSSTLVSAVGSSNAGTAATASFVGNALDGEFGSLLLRADGSYTYNADANTMPLGAVDVFSYEITDADGDTSTTTLTITHTDSGFDAVADDVAVNEAGLVGGSSAGDGSHMVTGSLADPGLGGTAPYTFTLQDPAIGNNGTLSLDASTGAYTYTLTSPVTGVDTGDNAANTVDNRESFSVLVADADGNTETVTITVDVIDDVPVATLDTDTVTEGTQLNVLAAEGVLSNDVLGADNAVSSTRVSAVGSSNEGTAANASFVGNALDGEFGSLLLRADGSYTYNADANTMPLGAVDVFSYEITDADGDTSTTTLTITHTDSGFDTVADDVAVNEAGLVGGSSAGDGSHMVTGSLADPGLGGTAPYTFTLQDPAIGNNGTLSLNASTGAYTYTLTSPVTGVDTGDNAANTVDNRESFSVLVADADGNTETVTITVDVIDDVPVATLDTDTVTEGTQLNVLAAEGVLSNDVLGADNAVSSTRVSAVGSSNEGTAANASFVGNALDGEFGSLLLRADGSYTYNADANTMPLGAVDVFSYEITDADGDTSTTTLTITHTDSGFDTVADDVAVNEAGLVGGSSAGDGSHMVTGSLADPGLGGTAPYTFTLQDPAIGNNGTLSLDASTGAYTYTLTSPVTGVDTGDNAANTVDNRESFSVLVADADGNTETVTITVDVIDDVPVATLDTDTVTEGTQLNVLAAEGVLSNDVLGADNAVSSTRVSAVGSSNAGTAANASFVGNALDGEFGSLLLRADGSYTYNADANTMPLGAVDVFSYEITDADGDTSTTTLTITHTDSGFDTVADDVAVNEAGLVGGSSAGDGSHMVTGSLADPGLGGTAPYTFTLQDPATGNNGTLSLDASTGAYTYTLTSPVTGVDTGDNAANTVDNRESFSVLVADADGNTETVTITVDVIDDVPVAFVAQSAIVLNGGFSLDNEIRFDTSSGADGVSDVQFTIGDGTDVTVDGDTLFLDGTALKWAVSADGRSTTAETAGGVTAFIVSLEPGAGTYDVTSVSSGVFTTENSDVLYDAGDRVKGGNADYFGISDVGGSAIDIVVDAIGGTVNTDASDFGVASQWTSGGDGDGDTTGNHGQELAFSFWQNSGVPDGSGGVGPVGSPDGSVNDFEFGINLQGQDVAVFDIYVDGVLYADDVKVDGANEALPITVTTASNYSLVEIKSDGPGDFSVEPISFTEFVVSDFVMDLGLLGTDGDGDTATGSLTLAIDQDDGGVNGVVVDGIVEGLGYTTSSGLTGRTGQDGSFRYMPGDTITFAVGSIVLGIFSADEVMADGKVFLQEIAGVGMDNMTDNYVENMAVFLQSLDNDGDAYNGIVISEGIHEAFSDESFDLAAISKTDLNEVLQENGYTPVDEDAAMQHVADMLSEHAGLTEFEARPDAILATEGDDIFAFALNDVGDAPSDATISGFGESGDDTLDLRDLLTGEEDSADLGAYLNVSFDGANTVIEVSSNGAFVEGSTNASNIDQTITLEGVDLVGVNELSSVIQNMLESGQLITD